jgi:MSHA biogenesis protein MshI
MKHTINLLPHALKPQLELFTIYTVMIAMMLSFMSMFGMSSYMDHDKRLLIMELDALGSEINRKISVLNVINAELENRLEDPMLIQSTKSHESQLKQKKRLVAELQSRDPLLEHSFAELLEALALNHSDELWLTSITVMGEDMLFAGHAAAPSALPKWITQLSKTKYFAGREFDSAKLQLKDKQLVFELRTSKGEDTR